MKKLLMICVMVFGVMTFAHAQGGNRNMGTPEERATQATAMLTQKLTLTPDQQTKVKTILLDQNVQMSKAREAAGDDRKAMREQMMTLMKDNDEKINALLNEDQKKAYAAFQQERAAARQNRGGGPNRPVQN